MAFVSLAFPVFAAVVAIAYFLVPRKRAWIVLLIASYVFFWINSELLILVLFAQTVVTFLSGRAMAAADAKALPQIEALEDKQAKRDAKALLRKRKKRFMLVGVLFNAGMLLFLKYYNFFADNTNVLLRFIGVELPDLGLIVPIGISFYTLQAIAYVVDAYRGKFEPDKSLPRFMLFMSYFPQILQGPMPRYAQLAHQLYKGHKFDYTRMCHGLQLMLWGFFQKMVMADRLAIPVNQIFDNWTYYDGMIVFLAAAGYGLQVYCDFSGGINIARGFSQVLGIEMIHNFNQPYFSNSVEDFWRRWHIALGQWMRDYIFYSLSLSKAFSKVGKQARKIFGANVGKKIPPFIAMFIVYFLVGFWHGAQWTFIVYGIWNGIFIMFGILLEDKYAAAKRFFHVNENSGGWRVFQMFRTFVISAIGRLFSRGASMTQAMGMAAAMTVGWWDISFLFDGSLLGLGLNTANWILLVLTIVLLFAVDVVHEMGISIRDVIDRQDLPVRWFIYILGIMSVLIFGMYGGGYDAAAFIYQQF